ncbi:MAG: FKBP-type peptidyl-prolyl cis-trans isomerase [Bacteroidales bacterium]|nr:FKBP-type peptidyl-prolyl cis-trans isomerase [Bacteroidales bacterium]
MTYGTTDSVLFNTNSIPQGAMKLMMQEPGYPGDFYEMMGLMHLGDSVVFYQDAESFFTKTAGSPMCPPEMMGQQLTFNVKLSKIQTEKELQDEMTADMEKRRLEEAEIINKYVEENNITVQATESGLYVIVTEEGKGSKPLQGDKVKVHYTGTLLDGTKFDSSLDRGQPFEFNIGRGVIRGWSEGIAMLNVGSKARLIIPSNLGYGERGSGAKIPPFSPLIFDVELIEIVK